ncbi:MAG: hydrogenase iron-sulfur subunit [Chloroflexi bacterium]|nr:hydrogenase iron-sulfur subunit [Chloroflexota bacterium]
MLARKDTEKELFPGEEPKNRQDNERVGIESWVPKRAGWAIALEKAALWVERPFTKLAGTTQLNPFYHTGMLATFLAIVVGISGFYIFLFFQYGFDASYNSVATRIEGPFIARAVRALHKYASGALVVTTLLHAYRTLFMERFRGQRWLAWITGVVLTAIIWFAGVTGYWLVADQRAQLINEGFISFLNSFSNLGDQFVVTLIRAENSGESWPLLLLLLIVHVVLYLIVIGFFILHILRLKRVQFLPELYWTVGLGAVLIVVSALFPLGMLPQADLGQLPESVRIDPLFLFYLPTNGNMGAYWLWGGIGVLTAVSLALPWLPRWRKRRANGIPVEVARVNIIDEKCTGCTLCVQDCPYKALEMVERQDDSSHKLIAIADQSMCTSCGICIGSCRDDAITMGDVPPELLWESVAAQLSFAQAKVPDGKVKVVLTCERHAVNGARPFLLNDQAVALQADVQIVTLPCVGAAPPEIMTRALDAGASEVQIVGCPPFDCANREGNVWAERRIVRKRMPRLHRNYANAPVTAVWIAPDEFGKVMEGNGQDSEPNYLQRRRMFPMLTWRNFTAAFALLAVVMVVQVLLTDIPFTPKMSESAQVRVLLTEPGMPFGRTGAFAMPVDPLELQFLVDGEPYVVQTYQPATLYQTDQEPFYAELEISPGEHHIRFAFYDESNRATTVLYEGLVDFSSGQILRINYAPDFSMLCREGACVR